MNNLRCHYHQSQTKNKYHLKYHVWCISIIQSFHSLRKKYILLHFFHPLMEAYDFVVKLGDRISAQKPKLEIQIVQKLLAGVQTHWNSESASSSNSKDCETLLSLKVARPFSWSVMARVSACKINKRGWLCKWQKQNFHTNEKKTRNKYANNKQMLW